MPDDRQTPEEKMQEAEDEANELVRNHLGVEHLAPREETGAADRDAGPPARRSEIMELRGEVARLLEIVEDPGDAGS